MPHYRRQVAWSRGNLGALCVGVPPGLLAGRTFAVFASFWVLFGAATCVNNLRDYNLQQMGVDALVRYHTFTVGHSRHPRLQPIKITSRPLLSIRHNSRRI